MRKGSEGVVNAMVRLHALAKMSCEHDALLRRDGEEPAFAVALGDGEDGNGDDLRLPEVTASEVVCSAERMQRKRARHNQTERNRVARMNTLYAMIAKELGQEYRSRNKADLLHRVLEVLRQRPVTPSETTVASLEEVDAFLCEDDLLGGGARVWRKDSFLYLAQRSRRVRASAECARTRRYAREHGGRAHGGLARTGELAQRRSARSTAECARMRRNAREHGEIARTRRLRARGECARMRRSARERQSARGCGGSRLGAAAARAAGSAALARTTGPASTREPGAPRKARAPPEAERRQWRVCLQCAVRRGGGVPPRALS